MPFSPISPENNRGLSALGLPVFLMLSACLVAKAGQNSTAPPAVSSSEKSKALNNNDIKRFVEVDMSEDDVVRYIQTKPGSYSLSAEDLQGLHKSGVSIRVIREMQDAMLRKEFGDKAVPVTKPASPPTAANRTGDAADLSLSAESVGFGRVSLGAASDTKEITITNTGDGVVPFSPLRVLNLTNSKTNPFQITDNDCGTQLVAKSHCKLKIVFAPYSFERDPDLKTKVRPEQALLPIVTNPKPQEDFIAASQAFELAQSQVHELLNRRVELRHQLKRSFRRGTSSWIQAKHDITAIDLALPRYQSSADNARVIYENALLSISKQTQNRVQLTGTPKPWDYPFTRMIVGLDASAASSQDIQQKYFVDVNLTAPVRLARWSSSDIDPLEHRFWFFLNPRITSLPFQETGAAFSSLNLKADFLSDAFKGKLSSMTQGFDFSGGIEWICPYLCIKPRTGIGWQSEQQGTPLKARLSSSIVFGLGASTPFSDQKTTPPAFQVNDSILQAFGCTSNPTFKVSEEAFCKEIKPPMGSNMKPLPNISFLFPDRSRFFYKYYVGLRLKTHFFDPEVHTECGIRDNGKPVRYGPCEGVYNLFPGVIDITAGKDAAVSGGRLSKWIFRLDAVYPLPFATAFHIFGSTYLGFGKTLESLPVTLVPVSASEAKDANTLRVFLPRPNRDVYRIGLGVDLIELFNRGGTPAEASAAPPPPQ